MKQQDAELNFLLIFLVGVLLLVCLIFKPFIYSLILAIVFATVFAPVHDKLFAIFPKQPTVVSLFTTFLVLIIVVLPLVLIGGQVLGQATSLYSSLTNNGGTTDLSLQLNSVVRNFNELSPVPINMNLDIDQYSKQGLKWLMQNIGSFFANAANALMGVFVFLVALYYLFKDGARLKAAVLRISPLREIHNEVILGKLALATNASIRGSLVVACIQGILTAIGFSIFGVPSAILWGSVATVTALIPGVGTAIVFLPAVIYIFLIGQVFFALGLLIWGMTAVGLVDNFLGPKLVEKGMQLHPFIILLSILGGLSLFGPLGFLLGPLVVSLLFALIDIYFVIRRESDMAR